MDDENPKTPIFAKNIRWIVSRASKFTIEDFLKKAAAVPVINNNPPNNPPNVVRVVHQQINKGYSINCDLVESTEAGDVTLKPKAYMKGNADFYAGNKLNRLLMELYILDNADRDLLIYFGDGNSCYDRQKSFEVKVNDHVLKNLNAKGAGNYAYSFNKFKCFKICRKEVMKGSDYGALIIDVKIKFDYLEYDEDDEGCSCCNGLNAVREIFSNFYENKLFTDFTIKCSDDVELQVHRVFLAHASPFFTDLFAKAMLEKSNHVIFDDIDSETMKMVLDNIHKILSYPKDSAQAVKLFYAEEKFQIRKSTRIGNYWLLDEFHMSKVLEIFFAAEFYKVEKILLVYTNVIIENYEELKETDEWKKLSSEQLKMIMDKIVEFNAKHPVQVQHSVL